MFRLSALALISFVSFGADPALLKLLPPSATVVAGIDVERAKDSPFGQYVLTQWRSDDKGFSEFISLTGFDPRRDLREVMFASLPQAAQHNGAFVAKGTFDVSKFLSAAASKGAVNSIYQGANIIAKPNDSGWVAFLDGSTVIGGDAESVKAAIGRRQSGTGSLPPAVTAKIADLQNRYDAWIHTVTPGATVQESLNGPNGLQVNGEVLRGIQTASGGVKFGSNVRLGAEAIARSDRDAVALQDVVKFLAGMVQLNREKPEAADAAGILENLEITTKANLVTLSLEIPQAQAEKFFENRKQVKPRARRSRTTI